MTPIGAGTFARQKTLKKSVVLSGQGLHSGVKTGLILHPLPPNRGILFTGISGDVTVPAHLDYIGSAGYATSLRSKDYAVGTVEHLLAALHSYGITNLLVKVQGEIPIMDGSALEFCQAIEEAGVQEEDEECAEIVIDQPYRVDAKGGESIAIEPAEGFQFATSCVIQNRWANKSILTLFKEPITSKRRSRPRALWFPQRHRAAAKYGTGQRRAAKQFYPDRR